MISSETSKKTLLALFLTFVIAFMATFCLGANSEVLAAPIADPSVCPDNRTLSPFEKDLRTALGDNLNPNVLNFSSVPGQLLAYEGCPEEMGAWLLLPMPKESDRMQAVHATLLPDGKVLIVNGSSNRNRFEKLADRNPADGVDPYKGEIIFENAVY
ncbi:hypothetical protein, partial [Microcystis sp.]|uniref:hypothetical protein n=1 Tax=Microcystis sp. TaxID=1127 RepID=UPI00391D804A